MTITAIDAAGERYEEDFTITVNNVNEAPTFDVLMPPAFTEKTISSTAAGASSVATADVDGDGDLDLDLLSASANDNTVAWYENDGSGGVTSHVVTAGADGADGADGARSVSAADVDGDLDLVSASGNDNTIAWYENDGNENFTAHAIAIDADGVSSVTTAGVDDDGDIDVVAASSNDDSITW